jgi:hypothetical protein
MSGLSDMAKILSPVYGLYDSAKKGKAPSPLGGAFGLATSFLDDGMKSKAKPKSTGTVGGYS